MKCYCYETETQLILCVEDVAPESEKNLVAAWFEKTDTGFTKIYPMTDKDNGVVHTRDFYKVKDIFLDYVVEPFVDNKGTWLVRYFGRLCVGSAYIDVVADEKMNLENHPYDSVSWNGFNVFVEPFKNRYQLELERNRPERIKAMEEYIKKLMLTK